MPELFTIPQLAGLTFLAVASVVWLAAMTRLLRRYRSAADAPPAVPDRRQPGWHLETVELAPAEMDTFARLVRRLDRGH
ncbi:hypothetical protein ACWD25_15535 [Streptomyces sp. NPDC002920]